MITVGNNLWSGQPPGDYEPPEGDPVTGAFVETLPAMTEAITARASVLEGTWSGYLDADVLSAGPSSWPSIDGAIGGALVASPTLNTNWLSSGRKALDLNGTSQYITADAFAALVTGNDLPWAIAMQLALDDATLRTFFSMSNTAISNEFRRLTMLNTTTMRFTNAPAGASTNSDGAWTPATATEYVITASYSGTQITTTIWDGTSAVTIHDGASNNVAALTLNAFTFGLTRSSSPVQFFDGQFRRAAFRPTVFSAGDLTAVRTWWGK